MMLLVQTAAAAFALVGLVGRGVGAHFSFVHKPSQIACDWDAREGINRLSQPILSGEPFDAWWFHGQARCQDGAEEPFELPARGTVAMVMSSRTYRAPPPYGDGSFAPADPDYVMSDEEWSEPFRTTTRGNHLGGWHNIHSYGRDDTSGCALAIAYKSKANKVRPEDFVVFTVVHDCPKRQREYVDVPNLPACPRRGCICAWFWNPKNSGTKNFYMTPFVCAVTGADPDASPVDVAYAIPPRRCLDPENCNFGPRQPMYYLGAGDQINMAEPERQSPHYSIMYGFREGAQHDIFQNTNPRRHLKAPVEEEPPRCDGEHSRLPDSDAEKTSWRLKSPDCRCIAELKSGVLDITVANNETNSNAITPNNLPTPFPVTEDPAIVHTPMKSLDYAGNNGNPTNAFPLGECLGDCDNDDECQGSLVCFLRDAGDPVPGCLGRDDISKTDFCVRPLKEALENRESRKNRVWRHRVATFGPMDVVRGAAYKAGPEYFPLSHGPYRMDLSDKCYLYVTSGDGVVVWENPADEEVRKFYVVDTFTGRDPDPPAWPAVRVFTPWDGPVRMLLTAPDGVEEFPTNAGARTPFAYLWVVLAFASQF